MAVITLSRELGSGGDEIARQVCDLLRYRYFDKHLILEAAAEMGLDAAHVVDFSEERYEVKDALSRVLRRHPYPTARPADSDENTAYHPPTLDEAKSVELVKSATRAAFMSGDIVIVGRGGQATLQDRPEVLHVRIIAPMATRLKRLQYQFGVSLEEAQQRIERQDRATAEYLGRFFGVHWDDPLLYHLTINTGKVGIEGAVQLIIDAVVQLRAMSMA